MPRRGTPYHPDEEIPRPWKKYRSNKGNWYYYNPETNVSVWDLKEYLTKQDPDYGSDKSDEWESEFTVSKHKEKEIVLEAQCASVYDEIFNGLDDDDDDYDDYPSTRTNLSTSAEFKPQPVLPRPNEKPASAASAKRFVSKKSTVAVISEGPKEQPVISAKKIINLRPELPVCATKQQEEKLPEPEQVEIDPLDSLDIHNFLRLSPKFSQDKNYSTCIEFNPGSLKAIQDIRFIKRAKSNNLLDFLYITQLNFTRPSIISPQELKMEFKYLENLLY